MLGGDPGDDLRLLTLFGGSLSLFSVSVQRQQGAQVCGTHQEDGNHFMDDHGGGGKGQAAVDRWEVPDAAEQRPSGAAHQHQRLDQIREIRVNKSMAGESNPPPVTPINHKNKLNLLVFSILLELK